MDVLCAVCTLYIPSFAVTIYHPFIIDLTRPKTMYPRLHHSTVSVLLSCLVCPQYSASSQPSTSWSPSWYVERSWTVRKGCGPCHRPRRSKRHTLRSPRHIAGLLRWLFLYCRGSSCRFPDSDRRERHRFFYRIRSEPRIRLWLSNRRRFRLWPIPARLALSPGPPSDAWECSAYAEVHEASQPRNIDFFLERYCLRELTICAVEGKYVGSIGGAGKKNGIFLVKQVLQGSRQAFYVVSCNVGRFPWSGDVGRGESW